MLRASNHLTLNSTTLAPKSSLNPRRLCLFAPRCRRPRALRLFCRVNHSDGPISTTTQAPAAEPTKAEVEVGEGSLNVGVGIRILPVSIGMFRMSLGDQAFFLLAFIATTSSIAFIGLVIAAIPTLYAMKRTATSLAKLADTAREELPSTMAAIRLSGMEISDLTLELSDLSQEIADGVSKSAQAVQAAEAGIRQIGTLARRHTISMIQERASLPNISVQPVVSGAAKKTSRVVGQATRSIMNLISRGESSSEKEELEY